MGDYSECMYKYIVDQIWQTKTPSRSNSERIGVNTSLLLCSLVDDMS